MILIDSNIPMYLVGAAHPNKDAARRLIEASIDGGDDPSSPEVCHVPACANRQLPANTPATGGMAHPH